MYGTLHAINVSRGGVPKLATRAARVTRLGIVGDRQRDLRHHGGSDRAVCIYSLELIARLRDEGHPITAGSIGENLTLAGIEWAAVAPGTRLSIGTVLLEVTTPANPCRNIASSFAAGDFVRVSEKVRPGWARWYCRVLEEGDLETGDRVIVSTGSGGDQ